MKYTYYVMICNMHVYICLYNILNRYMFLKIPSTVPMEDTLLDLDFASKYVTKPMKVLSVHFSRLLDVGKPTAGTGYHKWATSNIIICI